uniref:ADP-ribosylation factor-like protein 2-binding protein n=1 Tax=Plectus sambesii TaxID=2011161 RepID=A0A914X4W6_9BILA
MLDTFCDAFSEDDENKLEYMDYFEIYKNSVEQFLTERLARTLPADFNMDHFLLSVEQMQEQLTDDAVLQNPDIQNIITSIMDFCAFKELVLSRKEAIKLDGLAEVLSITPFKMQ